MVYAIEQQQKRGWRDVTLAETPDNASMVLPLREAIETRGHARVRAKHPELSEAQARIQRLRKSAVLDHHVRHFAAGRCEVMAGAHRPFSARRPTVQGLQRAYLVLRPTSGMVFTTRICSSQRRGTYARQDNRLALAARIAGS